MLAAMLKYYAVTKMGIYTLMLKLFFWGVELKHHLWQKGCSDLLLDKREANKLVV